MNRRDIPPPTRGANEGLSPYQLEKVSFAWPNTKTGHLWITVGWRLLDNRWECVTLGIDTAAGARLRPLQTNDLRRIKMGELLEYAAGKLRDIRDDYFPPGSKTEHWSPDYDETGEVVTTVTFEPRAGSEEETLPRRPGRPPVALATLQEVAQVYGDAHKDGEHPTKAVQEHFGIKTGRAARWVWLCRKEGLLMPTLQGRAGGVLPLQEKEGE